MKLIFLLIFAAAGMFPLFGSADEPAQSGQTASVAATPKKKMKYDRLPAPVQPETQVLKEISDRKTKTVTTEIVTAEQRLNELGAKYKKDKLVDGKGREIRFFEPLCRGVSEGFEADKAAQQEKDAELARLKKSYTVIVLHCDLRKML